MSEKGKTNPASHWRKQCSGLTARLADARDTAQVWFERYNLARIAAGLEPDDHRIAEVLASLQTALAESKKAAKFFQEAGESVAVKLLNAEKRIKELEGQIQDIIGQKLDFGAAVVEVLTPDKAQNIIAEYVSLKTKLRLAEAVVEAGREVYEEDDFVTDGVTDASLARDQALGDALAAYDKGRKGEMDGVD